jgi:CBS domain containing-hemolysin-like protein
MGSALLVAAIVAFLILVNALYVAAEFAAVGARRSRIQALANSGNRLAELLLPVVGRPAALDRYVATCQIGITLSSLALGAYGQAALAVALAPRLEAWAALQPVVADSTAALLVLVTLTALQVVVGELIPKSVALQNPTATALYTVLPMRWSMSLFKWFIAVLNGSGVFVLKLFGMSAEAHRQVHSRKDLEALIAKSRDGGLLEPDEQRRLHQALRLGLHTARQLMVPRTSIVALDVGWSGQQALEVALGTPFSRLPVYEESIDRVIGILNTRDLVPEVVANRGLTAYRHLIRPPYLVPETMPAIRLLRFLREHRTHLALVIDEFGGVSGLVTLEDVLSELLGGIGDEFRTAAPGLEQLPDGRVRMPGQTSIVDAQRYLGLTWDSEADTLAGHVIEVLGRLPLEGDQVTIGDVRIEVERLRGRVPATLLVTPSKAPRSQGYA